MAGDRLSVAELLRPHRPILLLSAAAMTVQGLMELLEPWPLKVIFDYVLVSQPLPAWVPGAAAAGPMAVLNVAAVAVVAIAVVNAVSAYTEKFLSSTVGKRVGYELRRRLYHHVQRLSLSFYERRQAGDMVVRLTSDIDAAEEFIASVLQIALDLITIIGMTVVMFYLDWRFSLIGLSVAPAMFVM